MKINKESIDKCKEAISKYTPETLYPEGLGLLVYDAIFGPKIASLRLKGYSDEEIIDLLKKEIEAN